MICPRVKEKEYLQEYTFFTFDLDLFAQYPLYHVTYAPAKFEIVTFNDAFTKNVLFDLDTKVKVIRNVAQFSLHHVIYAPAKFAVAMSHSL